MSNNTKSGFEIRADLLSQAQGILEGNIQRENESVYSHNDVHPENKKVIKAHSVTTSDVISVAKELYEFVNQK